MAKRRNPRACQLVRGFLLGLAYEQGHTITTERIRKDMGASRATAKRDMKEIAKLVLVTPSKPVASLKAHFSRRTLRKAA